MLCEYQLTNFKAFAGPETIPIRPITLIYGPNSSGKSSVLQSLLLLRQTIEEAENPETLLLPRGNLLDLGGYREFIHYHDVSKSFSFKVFLDFEERKTSYPWLDIPLLKFINPSIVGLHVTFTYNEETVSIGLSSIELFIGGEPSPAVVYKPEKLRTSSGEFRRPRSPFRIGNSSSSPMVLKIDWINERHSFWESWWNTYSKKITRLGCIELDREFQRLGVDNNTEPQEEKERMEIKLQELQQAREEKQREMEERKQHRNELKEREEKLLNDLQKELEECEQQLNELKQQEEQAKRIIELIRLRQRFNNYTLEQAREDFSIALKSSFLSYRNFLPVPFDGLSRDNLSPNFNLLSRIYGRLPNFLEITLQACFAFKDFIDNTIYIGPLREFPERYSIYSGNLNEYVGKSGKMVPDVLFKKPELLEQVNQQLERFGVGYELKVTSVTDETSELSDVFALRLVDNYTGVNVSILDVGFGISQVLPIIVQSMLSRNQTLLIEQPEVHIHPRLQTELGSLLAECIKSPFNNKFIIETHSEHLMLRLQKLIRKGELKPEDVAVIYVDRTTQGSKCLHLRLDEEGDFIDEWPDGFFEEDFHEIFN